MTKGLASDVRLFVEEYLAEGEVFGRWSCLDGPVTEETANQGHYLAHFNNPDGKVCGQAKKEYAAAVYLRRVGTLDGWEYAPWGPSDYDCSDRPVTEETANRRHYKFHRRRLPDDVVCGQAKKEYAAAVFLRKHGTLDGWEYAPTPSEPKVYDCSDRPVTEQNMGHGHYSFHYRTGNEVCLQAKKESAAGTFFDKNGTLEGWEYHPAVFPDWDCSNDDPEYVGKEHFIYHNSRREPKCLPSVLAYRRWRRMRRFERLPDGLDNAAHKVYVYVFDDGFRYIGITYRDLAERDEDHRRKDTLLRMKLRAGHSHTLGEIGTFPNRREAEEAEAFLIEAIVGLNGGGGMGLLLNRTFVPRWYQEQVAELVTAGDEPGPIPERKAR